MNKYSPPISELYNEVRPDELWNLDYTIACFLVPRLKAMRENLTGYPGPLDSIVMWEVILDNMIKGFEVVIKEDAEEGQSDARVRLALQEFAYWYNYLWL